MGQNSKSKRKAPKKTGTGLTSTRSKRYYHYLKKMKYSYRDYLPILLRAESKFLAAPLSGSAFSMMFTYLRQVSKSSFCE